MRKNCDEHENNYFVGGCITCTFAEYQKYMMLYEEAMETLVALQENRMTAAYLDDKVNARVRRYATVLAGSWQPEGVES